MFYHYKFWHSLKNPAYFTNIVEEGEIAGYKKRVFTVFILFVLLFAAREFWGMGTENLTSLFAMDLQNEYYVARLLSMLGAILWATVYFCFHYYGVTYILHLLTDIPYTWIKKIQLYVVTFLLIEKAILFAVFSAAGYTTLFSFFSLAPLALQIIETDFILFTINQITITTIVIVIVQYLFLSKWEEAASRKILIVKLIGIQLFMALFIGMISVLPIKEWIARGLG
ncbi:hypothetical protein I6G82_15230 [Lysinibacillus macroides]|uniref:Yip1 domain-containing protein n=1 Tax=Lysinibacillus macroides TaxID=33935 RepID=A0A0M9DMW2_9BACI|nr:hypothetical protein [Lysinibacillus macroides]KOY83620.1 hypothetical protein ADM90_03010 [Lysinibacillus macroides]QPR66629.1 hypothetical protein I6G82_15230 [Lysinibacillus macroides]